MKLTAEEFRQQPDYVSRMRQIFEDPVFQMALEAMDESENPMNRVAPPDISPHSAYILLGEQTGWRQYRTRFMLLSQLIERPQGAGEPTYADTEETAENKGSQL